MFEVWWDIQLLCYQKFIAKSAVKEFWKSFSIWQSYRQNSGSIFFWTRCIYKRRTENKL